MSGGELGSGRCELEGGTAEETPESAERVSVPFGTEVVDRHGETKAGGEIRRDISEAKSAWLEQHCAA